MQLILDGIIRNVATQACTLLYWQALDIIQEAERGHDMFGGLKGSSCGSWECKAGDVLYAGDLYAGSTYMTRNASIRVDGIDILQDGFCVSAHDRQHHWSI